MRIANCTSQIVVLLAALVLVGCTREKPPIPPHLVAAVEKNAASDPVAKGKALFAARTCAACHQIDAKVIGPPLRGVVQKRGEDWVRKMIQSPEEMVSEDPTAKALFEEYKTPMPNLNVSDDDTNAILVYLKSEQ